MHARKLQRMKYYVRETGPSTSDSIPWRAATNHFKLIP